VQLKLIFEITLKLAFPNLFFIAGSAEVKSCLN